MGHMIVEPWDIVIANDNPQWHRMAKVHAEITDNVVEPQMFDILETSAFSTIDGTTREIDGEKVLWADHRKVRPDLTAEQAIVKLHVPKVGYRAISNRDVWNTMKKALTDLGCKVASVCTLERGKKFALSVDIGGSDMVINKNNYKAFLNMVTSHDGTIAMEAFDAFIKIICMNTFQWSRDAAKNKFKIYHTKNADLAMDGLGDLLNAILKGRVEAKEVLEYLATHSCDANDAMAMAAGFFCMTTEAKENKLSTRSFNAATEITRLYAHGIGNEGRTLYDLANGATEYWTSGLGVGRNADTASQVYRSEMGSAADRKHEFITMLADDKTRPVMLSRGREAVRQAVLAN
jgi:hypothetical protein